MSPHIAYFFLEIFSSMLYYNNIHEKSFENLFKIELFHTVTFHISSSTECENIFMHK